MANEDPAYLTWIRTQPCLVCRSWPVDAHHATGAGVALRSHDHTAIPLCRKCHDDAHCFRGFWAFRSGMPGFITARELRAVKHHELVEKMREKYQQEQRNEDV